jgi:hypothetical protein
VSPIEHVGPLEPIGWSGGGPAATKSFSVTSLHYRQDLVGTAVRVSEAQLCPVWRKTCMHFWRSLCTNVDGEVWRAAKLAWGV